MELVETTFEHWQIRCDPNLIGAGVALIWQVTSRYERNCLLIQLLTDGAAQAASPLAEICVFAGGQVEVTTHLPLTVYADPRAAILSLELAVLFTVEDGVLSVEPG